MGFLAGLGLLGEGRLLSAGANLGELLNNAATASGVTGSSLLQTITGAGNVSYNALLFSASGDASASSAAKHPIDPVALADVQRTLSHETKDFSKPEQGYAVSQKTVLRISSGDMPGGQSASNAVAFVAQVVCTPADIVIGRISASDIVGFTGTDRASVVFGQPQALVGTSVAAVDIAVSGSVSLGVLASVVNVAETGEIAASFGPKGGFADSSLLVEFSGQLRVCATDKGAQITWIQTKVIRGHTSGIGHANAGTTSPRSDAGIWHLRLTRAGNPDVKRPVQATPKVDASPKEPSSLFNRGRW